MGSYYRGNCPFLIPVFRRNACLLKTSKKVYRHYAGIL